MMPPSKALKIMGWMIAIFIILFYEKRPLLPLALKYISI
jgi:hypothetical protein